MGYANNVPVIRGFDLLLPPENKTPVPQLFVIPEKIVTKVFDQNLK
jgi:hypothetical protein